MNFLIMEDRSGPEGYHFYGIGASDLRGLGKRGVEWNSSDWKWDGHLFLASPVTPVAEKEFNSVGRQFFPLGSGIPVAGGSSNSSSSCSDEGNDKRKEGERKRRVIVVDDDNNEVPGGLSLKLGGHESAGADREVVAWEGVNGNGKKSRVAGGSANRAVCQVEDCGADLSGAKDYHRRHKVCEMHSKASRALVGNVMQRFCQQCSR